MEIGFLQETKTILKSLVLSSPNGMTLEKLNRDYKNIVGNWIPYQKLGFPNLELFLRSIPDTLVITGNGLQARVGFVASEKIKHINEMVSRQKNTTRERKTAVIQSVPPSTFVKSIQQAQYNVSNCKPSISNTTYCGYSKHKSNTVKVNRFNNNDKKHLKNPMPILSEKNDYKCKTFEASKTNHNSQKFPENKQDHSIKSDFVSSKSNSKSPVKQDIYQRDVSQEKRSDNILQTPSNSMNIKNNEINISVSKILDKIDIKTTSENTVDEYVHNSKHNSVNPTVHATAITEKGKNISSNPIIFPCKPVSQKPTSQNIFGTNTIPKMMSQMKNQSQIINPFSQNDTIENDDDIDEAVPEFAANGLVFRVDFPENTVGFGQKIPRQKLPTGLVKGVVIGVFISEIHSPFKFWFHIYKENHELDILMNRIERFYSRLSINDLVIPKNCLAPGHVCAALYNDMWHRAEVLNNVCNNKVKVNFVDYGTVSEIDIKNIKYLPEIFAHTPMQAIRGSLSHIKPVSSLWPKSAVRAFLSMVSEILLYAQIIEIDEKDCTVYMVLCDTNGSETVQINKQMVDKGYALLDSEWDENKITKNGYRKRHPRDIFPTFEMLETGEYPSLSELENLLAQGIDYETLTDKIILSNNSNEIVLQKDSENNALSFNLLDTNPFKSDIISEIVSLKIFGD